MTKIIQKEMIIKNAVPMEVMERVRAGLDKRAIDFSDIPELTDWLVPPTVFKVSFDAETARIIRDKAIESHKTPAQTVSELVKKELMSA